MSSPGLKNISYLVYFQWLVGAPVLPINSGSRLLLNHAYRNGQNAGRQARPAGFFQVLALPHF
jgi:hypothetical protein